MNATLQVQSIDFGGKLKRLKAAKGYIEQRMAESFRDCVLENIGGSERFVREPFHPLSPSYARKVGRSYATLEVSKKLRNWILIGMGDDGSATVEVSNSDVAYATALQEGVPKGNRTHPGLPARPYFPIDEDGTVLPEVAELISDRAREEVERILLS